MYKLKIILVPNLFSIRKIPQIYLAYYCGTLKLFDF